jgi:sugar phosphate isomerase/epimerase
MKMPFKIPVRLKFRLKFLFADQSQRKLHLPFASGICLQGYLPAEAQLEAALRSGCSHFYVDVSSRNDAPAMWSAVRVQALMKRVSKVGVYPIVHGDFNNALSSEVEITRRDAVIRTLAEIDLARQLGAPLVIHPSNEHLGHREPRDRSVELDRLLRSLAELEASRHSVPIWLENVTYHEAVFSRPDEFELILTRAPKISMMYDIGHANVDGGVPERMIAPFAHRIAGICLSDNHGDLDSHLPLGQGSINWRSVLAELRSSHWQGLVVFEAPQAPPKAGVNYLNSLISH